MKNCLLLGRKRINIADMVAQVDIQGIRFFSGINLEETKEVFVQNDIDIVIMGAGIDLTDRLEIVKYIFEKSNSTTVHMKDWDSGPPGMVPFVNGVLNGLQP